MEGTASAAPIVMPAAAELAAGKAIDLLGHDDPRWMAFVRSRPEATIFHHPAWSQMLAASYGYRPFVMVQTVGAGCIVAGLPAVDVRSPLTGRRVAALPFTDHCPPLARDGASLAQFSSGLAQWWATAGRPRLEIHGAIPPIPTVATVEVGVRHTLELDEDPQRLLLRSRRDTRQSIQRARRDGVEVRLTRSTRDLASFYRLHLQTRRRLGVPIQPRRFLNQLWTRLIEAGMGFAVLASVQGRTISGAIFLAWNGQLIYKYSASDAAYWKLRANKLVVWTAMEWACRNGFRLFDYGKTDFGDKGLRDFKSSWGSIETPLTYSFLGGASVAAGRGRSARMLAKVIQASPPVVCRMAGELLYEHFA